MQQKSTGGKTDVIQEILEDCLLAYPVSSLLISLYKQYGQRGFLTKKQLEGLYAKASSVVGMHQGRLATLEAMIKRMPNRYKSALPEKQPIYEKDTASAALIEDILKRYPQHKRVLFLKSKVDHNEALSVAEQDELKRFMRLLK